jgi:hypothetical protein
MHPRKEYSPIFAALRAQGWRLETTSKQHVKCFPPDKSKEIVVFSMSGSDHRAIDNAIKSLERQGFVWSQPETSAALTASSNGLDDVMDQVRASRDGISSVIAIQMDLDEMAQPSEPDSASAGEVDVDEVYSSLKEAKTEADLADIHLTECEAKLEAAKHQVERAQEERKAAHKTLRERKQAFDRAFGAVS